jgi:hypothetical protein
MFFNDNPLNVTTVSPYRRETINRSGSGLRRKRKRASVLQPQQQQNEPE